MKKYPITQTLIVNIYDVARSIEELYSDFLETHKPGFYIGNRLEPVIESGKNYYYKNKTQGEQYQLLGTATLEELMTHDEITDADFKVIFRKTSKVTLVTKSEYPVVGISLIKDYFDSIVNNLSSWKNNSKLSPDEVLSKFLNASAQCLSDHDRDDLFLSIRGQLNDLENNIRSFIGKDRWVVHFTSMKSKTDYYVEKSIDYRIADWEEKVRLGVIKW